MVPDQRAPNEFRGGRPPLVPGKLQELSKQTTRTHRLLLRGRPMDSPVFEIPVKYLYFSIENGRYADRMIKLRAETPNVVIDPRSSTWIKKIQDMLMGRGKLANPRDKNDSKQLLEDIKEKTQIVPGIVAHDGGVLDGNRRLSVLMELGREYFDGVILPDNVSSEDKWRIEAGLQMGKPIVLQYSPMNELLKIRQGIELFKMMKKEGTDPSPNKTPEELVAETLYGRDRKEIDEMTRRLRLIEEYLDWLKKPGRFDIVGDRAERFKEVLIMIDDAKKADMSPKEYGDLKAMLFANVFSKNIDNWDVRELRKAVPGSSGSGRPMVKSKKASRKLMTELPDAEALRKECTDVIRGEEISDDTLEKKLQSDSELRKATTLANVVVDIVRDENKSPDPNRLLGEAVDRLEGVLELIPKTSDKAARNRIEEQLRIVSSMVERALGMLKRGSR